MLRALVLPEVDNLGRPVEQQNAVALGNPGLGLEGGLQLLPGVFTGPHEILGQRGAGRRGGGAPVFGGCGGAGIQSVDGDADVLVEPEEVEAEARGRGAGCGGRVISRRSGGSRGGGICLGLCLGGGGGGGLGLGLMRL